MKGYSRLARRWNPSGLSEEELRDWTERGWNQGFNAATYAEPSEMDFTEAGVEGEDEEDLFKLEYDEAVEVLFNAAWEAEQNARQYSGHPSYDFKQIRG